MNPTHPLDNDVFYALAKRAYISVHDEASWQDFLGEIFYGNKEVTDAGGNNLFMVTLWSKKFEVAKKLFAAGVSADQVNNRGLSVFHSMLENLNSRFPAVYVAELLDIYQPDPTEYLAATYSQDQLVKWATDVPGWMVGLLRALEHEPSTDSSQSDCLRTLLRFASTQMNSESMSAIAHWREELAPSFSVGKSMVWQEVVADKLRQELLEQASPHHLSHGLRKKM